MEQIARSIRVVLEWGTFIACLWLGVSLFNLLIGFYQNEFKPSNYFSIWTVSFVLLALTVTFSIKSKWKTIATIVLLIAGFFFLMVSAFGFNIVMSNLFGEKINYTLLQGLLALIIGSALIWQIFIVLRSGKLK